MVSTTHPEVTSAILPTSRASRRRRKQMAGCGSHSDQAPTGRMDCGIDREERQRRKVRRPSRR